MLSNCYSWTLRKLHSVREASVWMVIGKDQLSTANISVSSVPSVSYAPVFIAARNAWFCVIQKYQQISGRFRIWKLIALAIFWWLLFTELRLGCFGIPLKKCKKSFTIHMFQVYSKCNATDLWDQCPHCSDLWLTKWLINPYPTTFPYGNGMVLHFYQ